MNDGIVNPLLSKAAQGADPVTSFNKVISGIIGVFMILGVLYFVFFFIMAGFNYISSNGDEKKVAQARVQLTNSLIGLVIIFVLFAVLELLGSVFGFIDIKNITLPSLF